MPQFRNWVWTSSIKIAQTFEMHRLFSKRSKDSKPHAPRSPVTSPVAAPEASLTEKLDHFWQSWARRPERIELAARLLHRSVDLWASELWTLNKRARRPWTFSSSNSATKQEPDE